MGSIRSQLKVFPPLATTVRAAWKTSHRLASLSVLEKLSVRVRSRGEVFEKAYATDIWGSAESKSGSGSELGATETLRSYLPELFTRLKVERFLDAPCGDWN